MFEHYMMFTHVPFRHGERISFSYLVSQKYTGDNAVVKVLRNPEILEFNIKLATHKRLIPAHINSRPPSYYIIAGFVFTAVTVPYLRSEVLAFNGNPVRNLKYLAEMVESCEDEFLKFDLEYQQVVVLQTKTAKAATFDILATHCIPSAMSGDLKT
ncbi:hypothetical protein Q3G72_028533 [Acer saccharum]|nr:hypothetical protein Q3G72_028533 [Acer saccharum]